ncbi:hypothetical protein T01_7901 [Trichinella spiralis]|uniref:Uncharacterized protein n=1 Tax=Trichinella spiralis TaxID=6334 RepID=A0A0V1BN48_TRISP|nr:hypothetical protein T01_7901 [Trichinella spiralis]
MPLSNIVRDSRHITYVALRKQKESDGQHQVVKRLKLLQIHSPLEDIAIFGCRHLCAIWNQQKAFVPQEISTTTCSSSIVVLQSSDRHINCYSERVTVYVHVHTGHHLDFRPLTIVLRIQQLPVLLSHRANMEEEGKKLIYPINYSLVYHRNSGAVWIRRLHRATVRNKKKEGNSGAVWIRRLHRATVRNKKKEEEEEEIDH